MIKTILITNIQRFSLHDGPGIRTTVFLKGCSLRCPWCSNPENLAGVQQKYMKDGAEGVYGKWYTSDELYKEIIKDKEFYNIVNSPSGGFSASSLLLNPHLLDKLPGGVTFSGGECLLQIDKLEEVLGRLKEEGIHTAVETCLFVQETFMSLAFKYIDLFYVDIKILDEEKCMSILHGNLQVYLNNLDKLFQSSKPVVIRIPFIGGFTDDVDNRKEIMALLERYKHRIIKVEIMKEHNLGTNKYKSLIDGGNEIQLPEYYGISDCHIELYKEEIVKTTGLWTEVCKI